MNMVQKTLMEVLEQFGALREEQAEKVLQLKFPHTTLNKTIFPLLTARQVWKSNGYILARNGRIQNKVIEAFDIMLLIEPEKTEPILKGKDPFVLTFFKKREDKLWRYDICTVAYGTENVISAQIESINAKYRMIIFVLEKEEQMQGIRVACEHCYAIKRNQEYEFYLYSEKGE